MWGIAGIGDPPPDPGLVVDNRTDSEMIIYGIVRPGGSGSPGSEVRVADVDPRSVEPTEVCPGDVLIARTPDGVEVARRQPTGDCDDVWVIRDAQT
jgi:hypothetical protein